MTEEIKVMIRLLTERKNLLVDVSDKFDVDSDNLSGLVVDIGVWSDSGHGSSVMLVESGVTDKSGCELRKECHVQDGGRPSPGIAVIFDK
jgi:hypothetical protein